MQINSGGLAQLVERLPHLREAAGSKPASSTIFCHDFIFIQTNLHISYIIIVVQWLRIYKYR